MGLNSALSICQSGLANINAQLALVSQNIANACNPRLRGRGQHATSVTAGGRGHGRAQPARPPRR